MLHTPGIINNSGALSKAGKIIVWNEFRFDPRYRNKNYSVIETLNYELGKSKKITKKSRLHGAALSPNGTRVATIEAKKNGEYDIVVIDSSYGKELKRISGVYGVFYNNVCWSDDETVVVGKNTKEGKSIVAIDIQTEVPTLLMGPTKETIGNAFIAGDYLIYHSGYSGIDNIYALKLETKEHFQITTSKYGAYNAVVSNDGMWLYYNDHSVNGLDVVRTPFKPSTWKPLAEVNVDKIEYYVPILEQEKDHIQEAEDFENGSYTATKYGPLKGLINPHSWGPLLTTELNSINIGVLSENVLSTMYVYGGAVYDAYENSAYALGRLSYQGLWPIIELESTIGNRSASRTLGGSPISFTWQEKSLEGSVSIPLILTSTSFLQSLTLEEAIGVREITNHENDISNFSRYIPYNDSLSYFFTDELINGNLNYNRVRLVYNHLRKQSTRDINPSFGQRLAIESYHTFGSSALEGSLWAIRSNFFFPGIFKHHSLNINLSYQKRLDALEGDRFANNYAFRNRIFKPRGYDHGTHNVFTTISTNYALPLLYPDLAIGPLLNIKRFKANLFYDYGMGEARGYFLETAALASNSGSVYLPYKDEVYNSFGIELKMDFNVMRFPYDFEIGVRYSYAQPQNPFASADSRFEFIIGEIGF